MVILVHLVLNRPEPAKEEEKKFGVEDSKLPGASALPPAPLPVSAGALPASVISGKLSCVRGPHALRCGHQKSACGPCKV